MYDRLKKVADEYFEAFGNKDLETLKRLFVNDVRLFDPVVKEVLGKEAVLKANQNIFDSCKTIHFTRQDIFIDESKNVVVGELEFYLDKTKVNVVDVIRFNKDLKIESIAAYLDTGD